MAGIKLKKPIRLNASSILEVIIAMVIIVIVFGIAMGITANVQRLSLSAKQIHAQSILKEVLFKMEQSPDITQQTSVIEGLNITQEISIYHDNSNLHQVVLVAYDTNQQKLAELKEVVYDVK